MFWCLSILIILGRIVVPRCHPVRHSIATGQPARFRTLAALGHTPVPARTVVGRGGHASKGGCSHPSLGSRIGQEYPADRE